MHLTVDSKVSQPQHEQENNKKIRPMINDTVIFLSLGNVKSLLVMKIETTFNW